MKFFKGKDKKSKAITAAPPAEPRPLKDIQEECNQLMTRLAQNTYEIFVKETHNEQLNRRLLSVNQEGELRLKLDKAAAAPAEESKEK